MLKRIAIYLREMYPVPSRLAVAAGIVLGIEVLVLLTSHRPFDFSIGIQEIVAIITVFGALMALRIADEFKDAKSDLINFPHRPLPSGRVKREDLITLQAVNLIVVIGLNLLYMDNLVYFAVVLVYGVLMSVWFFARKVIQPSLVLALITHNPFQLLLVFYIISFVCLKHDLLIWTGSNWMIALIFYLPALAWEVSRKIKAPEDENQYTTYSKIWGYKSAVIVVLAVLGLQLAAICLIMLPLTRITVVLLCLTYIALLVRSLTFLHNPRAFKFGPSVQMYMYVTQTVLLVAAGYLLFRYYL